MGEVHPVFFQARHQTAPSQEIQSISPHGQGVSVLFDIPFVAGVPDALFFRGTRLPALEEALYEGAVLLAPAVAVELSSARLSRSERLSLEALLADLPLHPTPLSHWLGVGRLRSRLAEKGYSLSTPDAHVAACAIEAGAALWSNDAIFRKIAKVAKLRLFE